MRLFADAAERMTCFQTLERLRAARDAVARSKEPNGSPASKTLTDFEESRRASIEARATELWGHKLAGVKHWSGLQLRQRVAQINDDELMHLYTYTYRTMSWQTHPGLQGTYGLPTSVFPTISRSALDLAAFSYLSVLRAMISALQLDSHDPFIEAKLKLAHTLPYTDTPEEELELRRGLGL